MDLIGGTIAEDVVGGLASVAGGGKFLNGAVTAAFGYTCSIQCGIASRAKLRGRYRAQQSSQL